MWFGRESWWMGWSQSGEWWVNICNHWTNREVPGHSVLLLMGLCSYICVFYKTMSSLRQEIVTLSPLFLIIKKRASVEWVIKTGLLKKTINQKLHEVRNHVLLLQGCVPASSITHRKCLIDICMDKTYWILMVLMKFYQLEPPIFHSLISRKHFEQHQFGIS